MKKIAVFVSAFLISVSLFALSTQESGRISVTAAINAGKIPSANQIDPSYYLDDFAFPYKAKKEEPLSIFVQQSKSFVYSNGDENCIQIALKANNRDFFSQRDVNYAIFLTNPAFLQNERGKALFSNALFKILENKSRNSRICLYVASSESLIFVTNKDSVDEVLTDISLSERPSDIDKVLEKIVQSVQVNANGMDWQVLCVSDQDMFKTKAVQNAFVQLPLIYDDVNLSFAYIGYGVSSEWININKKLKSQKGGVYYENTYKALENRIYMDFDKFAHEGLENIKVRISYAPWLEEKDEEFFISEMNYDAHKIIMKTLQVPSSFKIHYEDFTYATVSVNYNFTGENSKTVYKTYALKLKFSNDPEEIQNGTNPIIVQNQILQSGAGIFAQVEKACNEKDYAYAMQKIDSQIKKLEAIEKNTKDRQVNIELENFYNLKKNVIQYKIENPETEE
ncbi:MAG: hypothetical protein ACTTHG_03185 [Treponemataceae bacterium]